MHGWKRAASLLAAASIVTTVAVGCGGSDEPSGGGESAKGNKDPVKVLAIFDMTGPTKYLGEADKAGLDAGVNYLNANGGIDGRKVEVEVVSDNGDPTTSVTTLTKHIASEGKPTFLFPGSYSSIAAALQPIATRNELLSWGFGNMRECGADKCGPYFQITSLPEVQITQAVQHFKDKGYKKIGVIQDQRETSVVQTEELKKQLPGAGIEAEYVDFPANAVNLVPQMSKLKSAGVDAVWGEVIGQASGYVLDAREKLNWDVPTVLDISASSTGITAVSKESQWKNDVSMQIFSMIDPARKADYPGVQLMLDSNKPAIKKGGFGGQPANVAVYGWDAMMLLDQVITATKSLDPKVNQQWLEKQAEGVIDPETRGLMTTHKYTAENHENQGWQPDDFSIVPVAPVGDDGLLVPATE
jgi:ABC-type branched-subunit amino acid transport system substrate-binding protein